jgi:hypothetical protein
MNVLEIDEGFGEFDYIIAHGVYSWTPTDVRDKLLSIARAHLSAQGVAFVSYNTYPGGYVRKMLREMMLYHIGDETHPMRKLERARELLQMMAIGRPQPNAHEAAVAARAAELLERTDSALYHDDLSDSYEPVYFTNSRLTLRGTILRPSAKGVLWIPTRAIWRRRRLCGFVKWPRGTSSLRRSILISRGPGYSERRCCVMPGTRCVRETPKDVTRQPRRERWKTESLSVRAVYE